MGKFDERVVDMVMTDQDKIKYFKVVVIVAVVIMTVMAVLLFYDNYKLMRAQNAYSQGWNECAQKCNAKIDILNDRCNPVIIKDIDNDIPVVMPDINVSDSVIIQIV